MKNKKMIAGLLVLATIAVGLAYSFSDKDGLQGRFHFGPPPCNPETEDCEERERPPICDSAEDDHTRPCVQALDDREDLDPLEPLEPCDSDDETCEDLDPLEPLEPCDSDDETCEDLDPLEPLEPCDSDDETCEDLDPLEPLE